MPAAPTIAVSAKGRGDLRHGEQLRDADRGEQDHGDAKTASPTTMMVIASAAQGSAHSTRRVVSDIAFGRGGGACGGPPRRRRGGGWRGARRRLRVPSGVLTRRTYRATRNGAGAARTPERLLEGLAREVGPELVAEDELRVGALPEQVVRDALLAARCGSAGPGRASRARRAARRNSSSVPPRKRAGRVEDLRPAAVVEGDEQRDPLVLSRRVARPSPSARSAPAETPSRRPMNRMRTPSASSSGVSESMRSPNIAIRPATSSGER